MLRSNHYDLAFERFLHQRRKPYVAVDETRRALMAERSLKSMDFIVYSAQGRNLLVDVKGRKTLNSRMMENWTTLDDILSLRQWESVFGQGFQSLLVFAYPDEHADTTPRDASIVQDFTARDVTTQERASANDGSTVDFRGRTYRFYGVWVKDFQEQMAVRSNQWQTVWLRKEAFLKLRAPIASFL